MKNKIQPWKEISRSIVFHKYGLIIEKVEYKLPNGKVADYYIKKQGPAASVLALTEDNNVILVKQYRPGLDEILFELPGGYVDANEKPEAAMKRELLEETGYEGEVTLIGTCYDDAYSTMRRYCFVATNCRKIKQTQTDEGEFVEPKQFSLDEFRKLLRSGKMTDVEVGYLGLDYLNLL